MDHWLREELYRLYGSAIRHKAEVSLGSGQRLYKAVERQLWNELGTADHNYRYTLLGQLRSIYRTAHSVKLTGVPDDLKVFAYGRFVEVLARQTSNYQEMVSTVARTVCELSGPREGLAFLIDRIEREPSWFGYANRDGWRHHSGRLGEWRLKSKDIGDLAPRLLRIVTDELRRELVTQQSRSRDLYWRYHYFWPEKAGAFAKVAEQVWQQKRDSCAAAHHIAWYFFEGLGRKARSVSMLLDAYARGVLDESAQWRLVDYLHCTNRHRESVPILVKLVRRSPSNLAYGVKLMRTYFRTEQGAELRKLLAETDGHFREEGRWNEQALSELAKSCLANELFWESVAYYKELIALHQRTHPRRGIGDGKLSSYYAQMASAYQGLRQTADAVEAAAGAIVSWGPSHRNRGNAIGTLKRVLRHSPNLEGYAETLDQQVAKTGLENPIVRRALGQVFLDTRKYGKAIHHLTLAAQVQPNDAETHQALIKAYDGQKDREGAIRQLLASAKLSRRNIALYRDLGKRLASLGREQEAERALTSIVEMQPTESESHTMLAEIREQQNRWPEAIAHWQRVAALRALEPTGLEKLARAQIHEKRWTDAKESIEKLLARNWPERFRDVHARAREMLRQAEANK